MSQVHTARFAVPSVVVSLLVDRRAQAMAALALALVTGFLLGPDGASATANIVGGL